MHPWVWKWWTEKWSLIRTKITRSSSRHFSHSTSQSGGKINRSGSVWNVFSKHDRMKDVLLQPADDGAMTGSAKSSIQILRLLPLVKNWHVKSPFQALFGKRNRLLASSRSLSGNPSVRSGSIPHRLNPWELHSILCPNVLSAHPARREIFSTPSLDIDSWWGSYATSWDEERIIITAASCRFEDHFPFNVRKSDFPSERCISRSSIRSWKRVWSSH